MTGRPTFGDFVGEARGRLRRDPPPGIAARHPRHTVRTRTVGEFARSMASILAVMNRYCADITAVLASAPRLQEAHLPATWARASIQAQEAIHNAAAYLPSDPASTSQPGSPHTADPAARRLDAATAALAAGRDLLHTHVCAGPDGSPIDRSEWGPVVTSEPVARALLVARRCRCR